MIVPVLVILGIAGVVYYLAQEPAQGTRALVGAAEPEVVVQPYRVTVSPRGTGSTSYGTLFEPSPPSATAIDRVVMSGGERWVPLWDKRSIVRTNPDRVEVYLRGEAAPRVFGPPLSQVAVYGGSPPARTAHRATRLPSWLRWLRP